MPIIMPPVVVDMPAIIQPAAHIAGYATQIQSHPALPPVARSAASSDSPLVVGRTPVPRPAGSSEVPLIVSPAPVTAPSRAIGPSTGTMTRRSGR